MEGSRSREETTPSKSSWTQRRPPDPVGGLICSCCWAESCLGTKVTQELQVGTGQGVSSVRRLRQQRGQVWHSSGFSLSRLLFCLVYFLEHGPKEVLRTSEGTLLWSNF